MLDPHWGNRRLAHLVNVARKRLRHYEKAMVTRPSVTTLKEALFWQRRLAFLEGLTHARTEAQPRAARVTEARA